MKKALLLSVLLALFVGAAPTAYAQDTDIIAQNPEIFAAPVAVPSELRSSVPAGWRAIVIEKGDLAGDATPEYVMVIEQDDSAKRVANDSLGTSVINTNPRTLLLLAKKGGSYETIGNYADIIPAEGDAESACLADPLLSEGGIGIEGKKLKIMLGYWLSCGSYGVTRTTYSFRIEGQRLRLIGQDTLAYTRNFGIGDETSINFLTGRTKTTNNIQVIGPDDGEKPAKQKVKWTKSDNKPIYMEDVMESIRAENEGYC